MMVRLPTIVLVYFKKTMRDQSSVLHVRTWPEPKAAICKPQSQLSPGTKSASSFILSFSAFRTVKNKCLSLKKTKSLVFCYSSPSWLTHLRRWLLCKIQSLWGLSYKIPQILFSYWYFFHKNIFLLFSVCNHFNMIV